MSKIAKSKPFRITFSVIFRLAIFLAIIYFSINFLGSQKISINVPLPNFTSYLPPESQQILGQTTEYLNSTNIPQKFTEVSTYIQEFPQKHFQQLKIDIINRLAKELVDRIQNK